MTHTKNLQGEILVLIPPVIWDLWAFTEPFLTHFLPATPGLPPS